MAETKKLNLFSKITQITGEIDKIAKTGKNQQQHYAYIEYAMVAGRIRELCAKYNLAIIPQIDSYTMSELATKTGGKSFHFVIEMTFKLVDGDNPDECIERKWIGEATDSGDKGINKAITAGEKYFLMRLFHISEKGMDEADHTSPDEASESRQISKASPEQLTEIKRLCKLGGMADSEAESYVQQYSSRDYSAAEAFIKALKNRLSEKAIES